MKKAGLADSPLFGLPRSSKEHAVHEKEVMSNQKAPTIDLDLIRKLVRQFGKEPTTHRLTIEEKKSLLKMVYEYRSQGYHTSENEIVRISINYLLQDRDVNKQNSIIDTLIRALYT